MADPNTGMPDVSQLLAPWMSQSPFDMSQYGGQGQFGASMLAAAGPTPYKQPFLAALGKGMVAGQQNALQNAQQRMGLGMNSLALQRQMAMWPFISSILSRMSGGLGGAPSATPSNGPATAQDVQATPVSNSAPPDASGGSPAPAPPQASSPAPWMGAGMNPFEESQLGALSALAGIPGGTDVQKDASLRLQYNPDLATSMKFAESPIAQDMMLLNAAARSNNPQFTQWATTKLRSDMGVEHIGSMSGIRTYQEPDGSWTTVSPSNGLRVNDRTGAQYMPGALQAFADREAAEKGAGRRAELGAETAPAAAPQPPVTPNGNAPLAPPRVPVVPGVRAATQPPTPPAVIGHAAVEQQGYIPPILAAPSQIRQAPGNTSLSALKELQEKQAENAGKVGEELQESAENAQTLLAQTAQIKAAAVNFRPSSAANAKAEVMSVLNGVGFLTADEAKNLGSYQDANKISIQLQATATKALGSREAAQVFSTMGKSIPNLTMSADGLAKVSAYMEGIARYNIARSVFAQRLIAQGNASGAASLPDTFRSGSNPTYYIMASATPQIRAEFLATMPAGKRQAFVQSWDTAIKAGLAPRPQDYEGQ